MTINAILFDFGQTLVDSAGGFREAERIAKQRLYEHIDHAGGSAQSLSWENFVEAYRRIRKEFHSNSRFSRRDIWQAVFDRFETPPPDRLREWESDYWACVKANTRPFPETLDVLKALKKRFRLGMITNTQGQESTDSHRIALFPEIEEFFDRIVVAGEKGVPPKPDPAPFALCLKQLGMSPRNAVFVGDDWRIDVCGARDAGLRPIWIKHRLVKRSWPDVDADVTIIDSLDKLLEPDIVGDSK